MTRQQQQINRMDSFIDCVDNYLSRLTNKVWAHDIAAKDIIEATDNIRGLLDVIQLCNRADCIDEEMVDKFCGIELELNKII